MRHCVRCGGFAAVLCLSSGVDVVSGFVGTSSTSSSSVRTWTSGLYNSRGNGSASSGRGAARRGLAGRRRRAATSMAILDGAAGGVRCVVFHVAGGGSYFLPIPPRAVYPRVPPCPPKSDPLFSLVPSLPLLDVGSPITTYVTSRADQTVLGVPSAAAPDDRKLKLAYLPLAIGRGRTLRELSYRDVGAVQSLAVQEFCPDDVVLSNGGVSSSSSSGYGGGDVVGAGTGLTLDEMLDDAGLGSLSGPLHRMSRAWEKAVLLFFLYWGFRWRIDIGREGRDHKVFCVSQSQVEGSRRNGNPLCAGVAEVSLQPTDGSTAPALPLSGWMKKLKTWHPLGRTPLRPYISNVLVAPWARREGVAQQMMQACEDQARAWGYDDVYLHVLFGDEPAVRLYTKLGYKPVRNDPLWSMSFSVPRLQYLRKDLRDLRKDQRED